MGAKSVSIVAAGAISPPDTAVRVYPLTASEIAENEGFLVGISIFRSMRDKGLISSEEYDQIHTRIANKSPSVLSDLYRYGTHAVAAMGCTNLTLENITVYSAPGMAFSVNRSDHFQVLDCNVTLRPESGRHVSSTADSLHIGNGKGYFIIEGCDFGYMGDDALNIHTDTNRIEKRVSEKTLLLGNFMRPVEGTMYSFRDASFGVIDFSAKVVNVQTEENGYRVEFETALPENIKAGCTVFQTEEAADYYIVRNNRFHNNRTRGVLLGTGNGIFEDNIIERTRGQAVLISVDQTQNWSEGSGVKNLVFRKQHVKGL